MSLTTLTSTKKFNTHRFEGLKIRGYYSRDIVSLPPVHARLEIPTERSHIYPLEQVSKIEFSKCCRQQLPEILNCNTGFLLGYDCPYVFSPQQTVSGEPGQPLAHKRIRGWSIIGGESIDTSQVWKSFSKRHQSRCLHMAVFQLYHMYTIHPSTIQC